MRRKPLNVVFNEGVIIHADRMVDQLMDSDTGDSKCTINRSEVLRCAMEIGLTELQNKIDKKMDNGDSPKGLIKISNIKAMLRK
mgnify:CR=1 FL=1